MKHPSTTRKSQFVRTLEYFRTADIEEAEACLQSATQIVVARVPTPTPARRTRKVRTNGADVATATPHFTGDEA